MAEECVFCEILSGSSPVSLVHEDEQVVAFMDIQPINTGHLLVVPRRHAPELADMSAQEAGRCFEVAHSMAAALRASGILCEGVNIFVADGEAAFQDVFHFHIHVIPRFYGDGFGLQFPSHYEVVPEREALDRMAGQIRAAVKSPA